jgi:hypothetical protein
MSRRRVPPELRRRTWTEGSVWELLVAADALLYRFASPLADLSMTARERRSCRREVELLKTTPISYILPNQRSRRRPPQPWLYVRPRRHGIYRVGDAGRIERYGARVQRLGSGSITEHGWFLSSLRGVRWLRVVADGLLVQELRRQERQDVPVTGRDRPALSSPETTAASSLQRAVAAQALHL